MPTRIDFKTGKVVGKTPYKKPKSKSVPTKKKGGKKK